MTQEQNPSTQTDSAPENLGSLDAAAQAFAMRDEPTPQEVAQDGDSTDSDSQDDDPNAEGDNADTDEDTAVELEEVDVEGIKLSLPKDQAEAIRKATLRQADYSRNMNEVGAQKKAYTQKLADAERLVEGASKYAEALAEIQVIDARLKQFDALNWQQLRQENPGEYAAYAADAHSLRLARDQAERKSAQVGQEVEQGKSRAFAEKRNEMDAQLKKDLKGWGDEMGTQITKYAAESGVRMDTLQSLTDPALVVALEKARKFDALQKSRAELKVKAKDAPPVLKPGAPRKQDASSDAMTQLRKFKTRDAAEVAFLARMR